MLKIIGLEDKFGKTASYEHLLRIHGLDEKSLAKKVANFLTEI